ncbi:unnamed protein product [Mytilus coruscus]|uniref:Coiled-coil domain-containing protein 28B n=1 Tax=Mytilus coruscus TaxID=42192 RepID=A0A6J8E1M4_MYTCO|nr:unnamed protein product [Mytilus coruscus]
MNPSIGQEYLKTWFSVTMDTDPVNYRRKDETFPVPKPIPERKASKSGKKERRQACSRPCKEHSFLTDVADVRAMEQGLLQLLEDFHSGKLQAFGGGSTFQQMDMIREQQECLARLHFELDIHQDLQRGNDEKARLSANSKLSRLIDQLHSISSSIQKLHKTDYSPQKR